MTQDRLLSTLQAFGEAWNRHDIDALMACMHDECVFEGVAGPLACGARHEGPAAVRKAFESAWQTIPDAAWRIRTRCRAALARLPHVAMSHHRRRPFLVPS